MEKRKKWEVLSQMDTKDIQENLISVLLHNRGITGANEQKEFLQPSLTSVTVDAVGIDKKQLEKTLKRIHKAIKLQEQIIVYGDYDVDGITGTAILWEVLHANGAKVLPYIPHRVDEGYGLSIAGIENLTKDAQHVTLIITVDNGIVAHEAVDFANQKSIDVIITDHHAPSEKNPDAFAIVHTTKLCGAGVSWLLSQELFPKNKIDTQLELAALGTVADLVPLLGANRAIVSAGLEKLRETTRIGLLALFKEAQVDQTKIDTYTIGHIIGPRLNAMGRMANAMDSLRLICTKDANRAKFLAEKLGRTNKERQLLTQELVSHAKDVVLQQTEKKKLLFIHHQSYEQGVIGLVAGRLVEQFYRPSIVLSQGETYSKASARSISGFNIIEFIRTASDLLINAGGHPMAAGFTVETAKLTELKQLLETLAEQQILDELLVRRIKIDCEIPLSIINQKVYSTLQQLAPFGMANPEPLFMTTNVQILDTRLVGAEGKHLKLRVGEKSKEFDAIAFNMGDMFETLRPGSSASLVYSIDENEWNGNKKLQLKIKDIKNNKE